MSVVFYFNTLLLKFSQSSCTSMYILVTQICAPRLEAKYSPLGSCFELGFNHAK